MSCLRSIAFIAVCLTGTVHASSPLATDVERDYDANLRELFLYFHAHPELSGKEINTAARLAKELRSLGLDVTEGVGGTGVVAIARNGSGRTVLIRADMDDCPSRNVRDCPMPRKRSKPMRPVWSKV